MRRRAIVLVLALAALAALAAPAASPAPAAPRVALTALEQGVLQQLNTIRAQHGLAALRLSAQLTEAAEQHSREMAADGYFEHNSYDGTAFWKRIGRWYSAHGYRYWSVGENLLWSSPDVAPKAALQLWMNSPEHRANILTARWREIGVAAVHVQDAGGTYRGLPVTIVTTDFGVRR
ncbi:MAG TPA: CAP domain-containing protein [Gaiellaceae bacterium]